MSNEGLPVTSTTSKGLIDFLSKYENLNIDSIPIVQTSNTLGWQPRNRSFLWGKEHIVSGDSSRTIVFTGGSEGARQIADSLHVKGSYKNWIDLVNQVIDYPLVISRVYFSFLPPFLEILGIPNFIVD